MKKLFLLQFGLLIFGLAAFIDTRAQPNIEIMGPRMIVDPPTSINTVMRFTYSAGTTEPWGGDIVNPVVHQEVVKAVDSEACAQLTGTYTGKWVLIYRGNCEFGAKSRNAQLAGAAGVIIWNHTPNAGLITMGAGAVGSLVNIPVIFISNEDGRLLTNQLSGGNQVFISLTRWGFDDNNDLSIVANSTAMTHAGAIPKYQFDGTATPAYLGYNGAFVANLGKANQTNVKLTSRGTFTPKGGSPTEIYTDTIPVATFNVSDSILYMFNNRETQLNPSGVGRYDFSYEVISDSTDATPSDNKESFSMEITDNVFCKGRFNVATQKPVIDVHYGVVQGTAAVTSTLGPMFYVKKGGHTLETAVFSVMNRDTNVKSLANSLQKYVDLYCFKWNDANSNNYMEGSELTLLSIAVKEFAEADSNNGKLTFSAQWGDNELGKPKTIILEDNSWYWFAANLGEIFQIGGDSKPNFHNRALAAKNYAANKRIEFWSPRYSKDARVLKDNPGDTVLGIPFGIPNSIESINIDTTNYTSVDGVTNIAIYTSVFPTKVAEAVKVNDNIRLYPNPAIDKVTLSYKLEAKESLVHFKVIDAFGRNVYTEDRENIEQGEITVSTANLAAGNYYFLMITGSKAISRAFTVISQ